MTDTIYTSQTPVSQDSDGHTRNIGMVLSSSTAKQTSSGRVWVPGDGLPATAFLQVWDSTGPSRLRNVDLNSALPSPTLNSWNTVTFSALSLTASHNYYVSLFQSANEQYVFTSGASFPFGSGGTVTASSSIYAEDGTVDDPPTNTAFSGLFFVDLNVEPLSTTVDVGTALEVDSALSIGANQQIAVGTAAEIDSALSIGVLLANTIDVGTALEVDTALSILANQQISVGTAMEIDAALSIGVQQVISVGTALEIDMALSIAVALSQTVNVGTAIEIDTALPIGRTGGGALGLSAGLSSTYILNALAGTLVAGIPTLTAKAAASVWAGLVMGAEEPWSYNVLAGNTFPQWLAIQGALNQIAGTTDLSVQDCLRIIAG